MGTRFPAAFTVKLSPAGAEVGVRGARDEEEPDDLLDLEDEEPALEREADDIEGAFATFLPFQGLSFTDSGIGGVGGARSRS